MSGARHALLALAGACAATTAAAQDEVTVYSASADSVSVTIYPDNLALITETRTVTLPGSAVTLVIQDVADTLLPQSAVVAGLDRPLAESNFDFNRLTRSSLLENAVGTNITLVRTNPATGIVSYAAATVLAAGEEILLELVDGKEVLHCSGLPEAIVFDSLPDGLYPEPRLSMRIAAGAGGERTIRVSYLAHGFTWTADYVAQLDNGSKSMDLAGWATVTNSSGRSFSQAELHLVAGRLNILRADEGGSLAAVDRSRLDEESRAGMLRFITQNSPAQAALIQSALRADCFVTPTPEALDAAERAFRRITGGASATYGADAMAGVVNVILAERENLGEYNLYRLPWRTDLGARQTKQVLFLDRHDAVIERIYRLDVSDVEGDTRYRRNSLGQFRRDSDATPIVPRVLLRARNTEAAGLGEPLPAGLARVFETSDSGAIFIGEVIIQNLPTGAEIELAMGRAIDVVVEYRRRFEDGPRPRIEADVLALNDKELPIEFELRHRIDTDDYTDIEVERSSRRFRQDGGDTVWRFQVPPGDASLTYTLSAREVDD